MGGGKSQRTGQRSVHRMFSKKPPDAGNLLAAGPIYMDVQAVRTGAPVRSGSAVQNHKEKDGTYMRRLLTGILAALILLTLAACGSEKTDAGNDGKEEDSATVNGVVNRMGDFLVLLTDDGTYQVFDFGEDVDQGRLDEGDSVTVTYTGELGSEDPVPVAVSVEKTDAV